MNCNGYRFVHVSIMSKIYASRGEGLLSLALEKKSTNSWGKYKCEGKRKDSVGKYDSAKQKTLHSTFIAPSPRSRQSAEFMFTISNCTNKQVFNLDIICVSNI